MEEADSEGACSDSQSQFAFVFIDTVRDASLELTLPRDPLRCRSLGGVLSYIRNLYLEERSEGACGDSFEFTLRRRFADSMFLWNGNGTPGEVIPDLRFKISGRMCGLDSHFEEHTGSGPIRVEIDRSCTGYSRNWPVFLARRWKLRAGVYSRFVESVVERSCGREAGDVLRLDTPERVRRFLQLVAKQIFDAPYETYSRYLRPFAPFKSCDQTLDQIMDGDGGNCAEKSMVLYFIAQAYGIPAEFVLGGEQASGKFPARALRSILDQRTFHAEVTLDAQRHWQHYALVCQISENAEHEIFCDVAGSNIPFLFLGATEAKTYLDPIRRTPLPVVITLDPIDVYYHRLKGRQDLPLDLYYAMEHFIPSIDVIHTVDNELGLIHTGDYWLGAVAFKGRRDLYRIIKIYHQFVRRAGLNPKSDVCFVHGLDSQGPPLRTQFLGAYPVAAVRLAAADTRLRQRVSDVNSGSEMCYVILRLRSKKGGA